MGCGSTHHVYTVMIIIYSVTKKTRQWWLARTYRVSLNLRSEGNRQTGRQRTLWTISPSKNLRTANIKEECEVWQQAMHDQLRIACCTSTGFQGLGRGPRWLKQFGKRRKVDTTPQSARHGGWHWLKNWTAEQLNNNGQSSIASYSLTALESDQPLLFVSLYQKY